MPTKVRKEIVYPELSYEIVGVLFDVYHEVGSGHLEKTYQQAVAVGLKEKGIAYQEQVYYPVKFHETVVGKKYFDFLIGGKIILELKQGKRFGHQNIEQVVAYLKTSNLQLALLANFAPEGVVYRRLVNLIK